MMKPDFSKPDRFYKYRSIDDLERFLYIIINKKLYGALYSEMNDPMEGYYKYDPSFCRSHLDSIVEGKKKTYICSMSRNGDNVLMWTHYANESKGCCIEVEVTSKTWERVDVDYSYHLPMLTSSTTARDILKVKSSMWSYEDEVRFLSPQIDPKKKRPQLSVKIHAIYVGCNVDMKKFHYLKTIIQKLDDGIKVIKMRKDWLDCGYI